MMKKISYIFILFISLFIVSNVVKAEVTCPAMKNFEYTLFFDWGGDLVEVKDKAGNSLKLDPEPLSYWNVTEDSQCPRSPRDIYFKAANYSYDGYYVGPAIYCPAVNDMEYNLTFDYSGYLYKITNKSGDTLQLHYINAGKRAIYTNFKINSANECPIAQNEFIVTHRESTNDYDVAATDFYRDRFIADADNKEGCSSFKAYNSCVNNSKFSCVWVERETGKVVNNNPNVLSSDAYCNVDNLQYVQCGNAFDIPVNIPGVTSFVINLLKILTPIILVFTSAITLLKAITANKEDDMNKAKSTLVRRIGIAALIFFTITITQFVINKVAEDDEAEELGSCLNCFINNSCEGNTYYKNNIDGDYQCFYTEDSTPFADQSKCH